jgi:glycosyltransferase involved in cell wall biosynthesis
MPFALNEATRYINPTKTLEYMAAGKPIVSTAVPDVVHNFASYVDIAASPAEFVLAAERACSSPDARRLERAIERAGDASWEAVVQAMRGHMLEAILSSRTSGAYRLGSDFP